MSFIVFAEQSSSVPLNVLNRNVERDNLSRLLSGPKQDLDLPDAVIARKSIELDDKVRVNSAT